jgi:hypothetical protein
MNAFHAKALTILALSALSASAFASSYSGSCTSEPKSKWMTEQDMKAKYEKQGYTVKRIKNEGSCYEVYAKDKNGNKTELFVNPVDGALVKEAGKS